MTGFGGVRVTVLRRLNVVLWVLLLIGGAGFLAYRIFTPPAGAQNRAARPSGAAVTVVPVEVRTIEIRKSYYGTVRSAGVQKVTAESRELIEELSLEVGDVVSANAPIVTLSMASQSSQVEARRASLEDAVRKYERLRNLLKAGGTSKSDVDKAFVAIREEEAKLRDARTTLSRTKIRAAFDGVVVRKNSERGEYAEPGKEILAIADMNDLEVECLVPPTDRGRIRPGQDVTVLSSWGTSHEAKVRRMDPEADPTTGFFKAIVALPAGSEFKPGDYLRIQSVTQRRENVLSLPYESVLRDGTSTFVFLVSGDTAVKRSVEPGETAGGTVEIVSGLASGDRVVKTGAASLSDGAKIRLADLVPTDHRAVSPDAAEKQGSAK